MPLLRLLTARPVRRRLCALTEADPEVGRMVDCSKYLRGLQQRLRRDTAAMQAGAADRLLLDERHLLAR